jgi:two-component sensor histidine kinase
VTQILRDHEDARELNGDVAAPDRVAALSEQLIQVHQALRERLASLRRIRELLAPSQGTEPGALARELDGLTAILESHFGYEERRLSRALDELDPATSITDVLTRPGALDG